SGSWKPSFASARSARWTWWTALWASPLDGWLREHYRLRRLAGSSTVGCRTSAVPVPMRLRGSKSVLVLLAVLLIGAPLVAGLLHHHANSSDNNCPVCHFNHQPMDRPLAEHRLPSFEAVSEEPASADACVPAAQASAPLPSRAPPTA